MQQRKQNRLHKFDYSKGGWYYITVCVKDRAPILSKIISKEPYIALLPYGEMVEKQIQQISAHYPVIVEQYVIMPDHIHMILKIQKEEKTPLLSKVIQQFKGSVTKQIGRSIWQRSFYDHVIRGKSDYEEIAMYIQQNPKKWFYQNKEKSKTGGH